MNFKSLFIVFLCFAASIAVAQETFSLEKQLPARTLFVKTTPNFSEVCKALEDSAFYKILHEEEMQLLAKELLEPFKAQIQQGLDQVKQQLGIPLEDLLKMCGGEVAIAVVDVDPTNPNMPLGALLSIQVGEHQDKAQQLLSLAQQMSGMQFTPQKNGDLEVYTAPIPVCYAFVGGSLVVSTKVELLQEVAGNFSGGKTEGLLHNSEKYQMAQKKIAKEGVVIGFAYLNVAGAMQLATQMQMVPPPAMQMIQEFGVDRIQAVAMGMSFHKQLFHTAMFVNIDKAQEQPSIFSLFDFGAINHEVIKKIPSHSILASVSHADYMGFIEKVEELMKKVGPMVGEDIFAAYQGMSAQLEQQLGFSIRNDFFGSFGTDNYSFSYMPAEGGLVPRTIQALSLKDEEKFQKCLDKVSQLLNLQVKELQYKGTTFKYFVNAVGKIGDNPFEDLERIHDPIQGVFQALGFGFSGMPFMVEDGYFYLASSGQDMKDFISNRGSWTKNITENPDFQNVYSTIPSDCSAFVYMDYRPLFNILWNTTIPFARSFEGYIRGFGVPLETVLLPNASTISQHFKPGALSYTYNNDGMYVASSSSIGAGLPMIALVGIGAAVAIPNILKARMSANESSAIGTMRSLATAQAMFQAQIIINQDGDGAGEYGFLQELTGQDKGRGEAAINPPFVSRSLSVDQNGIATKSGYYFYCYLPGEENAIGEELGITALDPEKDFNAIDAQETRFIIYAWPVTPGETGNRVFAINQSGEVIATHPYQPYWDKPSANAAFSENSEENTANIEGELSTGGYGQDGNYWSPSW